MKCPGRNGCEAEHQAEDCEAQRFISEARPPARTEGQEGRPEYRGPSGELWSGRGLKPRWLVAQMKQGKKLESFAVH
jgi:DNA-binding protein H-NS